MAIAIIVCAGLTQNSEAKIIPNAYIVLVSDSVDLHQAAAVTEALTRGKVGHIYSTALKGFSIHVPPGITKSQILSLPGIILVEPDLEVTICAQPIPTGVKRIGAHLNSIAKINGIDERVDVDIAIIDTGIDIDHPDLNVVGGSHFYTVTSGPKPQQGTFYDDNYNDEHGHGSHVAGIAAALDNDIGVVGVAPGARLWAVRVIDLNSGRLENILAGVDWVTANAAVIEVANISLSVRGTSETFQLAIQNSVAAGVVYFAAAGNDPNDIYGPDGTFKTNDDYMPAAFPEVATVSGMVDTDGLAGGLGISHAWGVDDSFASRSCYSKSVVPENPVTSPGAAIDLLMPAANIYSTYKNGGYATIEGTSMASPHAAGLGALYIAANGRASNAAGVYAIRQALIDGGVAQNSPLGLKVLNDRDVNWENIGWAGEYLTISGYISDTATNMPFEGVVVTADNGGGSDITDSDGYYEIEVSYKWSGKVVPSENAYRFEPNSITYANVVADQYQQNYAGSLMTFSVSGTVENQCGVPIAGVTMSADNGGSFGVTDANGFYEVWVGYDWSGTIAPVKSLYSFDPNSKMYSKVISDKIGENYLGDNIYDLDCNGSIGFGDIAVISDNWLWTGIDVPGDIYKDEIVNFFDYAELARVWGTE